MSAAAATGFGVAPIGRALLDDPVAFLSAEHARQLALLAHLERLLRAPGARGARVMAQALLGWLQRELPMHVADEELSLYPRLRQHDPAGLLARLSADHRREAPLAAETTRLLRAVARGEVPPRGSPGAAAEFAQMLRRHLEFEEAEVMPLARAALSAETRRRLATEMAARRLAGDARCPTEA
jgi:hemerythrin-like domain-containing protein